jgi:methionine-rich copper-binding protein CopC
MLLKKRFAAGVLLSFVGVAPALAEPQLTFAAPAANTRMGIVPQNIMLSFREPVNLAKTQVSVTNAKGEKVPMEKLSAYKDNILARFLGAMDIGAYKVVWKTVSKKGATASGEYTFSIENCGALTCP